ncbi:MAG: hypothetical protein WD851_11225 [Pirellulales bacterium]
MSRPIDPRNIEVVDSDLAAILRTKKPAERIEMVFAANRTARMLAAGGIRYQHPEWSDEQVQHEVVRRVSRGAK